MRNNLRTCSKCVSDTTVPGIRFDASGVCNFCKAHDILDAQYPLNEKGRQKLDHLFYKIKVE